MKKQRGNLFSRLAFPLFGLLITSHLLVQEDGTEARASWNPTIERLSLDRENGVQVLQETVYTKEQLFEHRFFERCFENRQVWGSFQMLESDGHTVCLYFVDFRTLEEADWAMQQLVQYEDPYMVRKCQAFGTVVAYAQGPIDTPIGILDGVLASVHAQVG